MRRIYESDALDRDDEDPFRPNASDARVAPRSARSVPAAWLSAHLLPAWLRRRAISVAVTTPKSVFAVGEPVPVTVTMKNSLPVPVTLETASRVPWAWYVDGHRAASRVADAPPEGPGELAFDRGERKRFRRTWQQAFRVSDSGWVDADPGEYVVSAAIDHALPGSADPASESPDDRTDPASESPDDRTDSASGSTDGRTDPGSGGLGDRTTIRIE
jgi:hypothetical protein